MIKKNLISLIALIISCISLYLLLFKNNIDKKVVFVETGKLYEQFKLTKEYNLKVEEIIKTRKVIVDSLYDKVRAIALETQNKTKPDESDMQKGRMLEEEYLYKKNEFEKENESTINDYNAKIWNQLNQYINDYGKENNYSYILGASGQGNIMYGEKNIDITDKLIEFVNTKYSGENKK